MGRQFFIKIFLFVVDYIREFFFVIVQILAKLFEIFEIRLGSIGVGTDLRDLKAWFRLGRVAVAIVFTALFMALPVGRPALLSASGFLSPCAAAFLRLLQLES